MPMEAATLAGHVIGRRAPAGRSVPVGPESLVWDPRRGHIASRRAPARQSVSVGPESESLTQDLCRV